jgi:hypothetical protein
MPFVIDPPAPPPLPPSPEDGSELWEQLYEAMGWYASRDAEFGYPLRLVCEIWCAPLQRIYDIVRERDDQAGWAIALDPDEAPVEYLAFLSQWVGAVLTPGMSVEQQRLEIREPTGWRRGQVPSIELIAKRESSAPDPWVRVRPRFPGPGEIYIRRLVSETPNPTRVETELLDHGIPAWELLDFDVIEGVTVADVAASTNWETVADLAAAFTTVQDLTNVLPDEI